MPPRLSISLRTLVIHSSISSALSRTRRKLVAVLRMVAFCVRNRARREFFGPDSNVPSSLAWLDICSTQCLPGMRSHAKAADSLPSLSTFSGKRSNAPSPAYCSTKPAVTRMYILLTSSGGCGFSTELDIRRLWFFSSFLVSAPFSAMVDKSRWMSNFSRSDSACCL